MVVVVRVVNVVMVEVVIVVVNFGVVVVVVVMSAHASNPVGHDFVAMLSYARHSLTRFTHGPVPNEHCSSVHIAPGATVKVVAVVVTTRQSTSVDKHLPSLSGA
jgi:hypothetical protein